MKTFKALLASLVVVSPLVLAGCPGFLEKDKKPMKVGVRKMKGDPAVFVKGTAMNMKNELPVELFDGKFAMDIGGFAEAEQEKPRTNMENGQEAPAQSGTDAKKDLENSFETTEIKKSAEQIVVTHSAVVLTFKVDNAKRTATLVSALDRHENQTHKIGENGVSVLHTSISKDRRAFSILFAKSSTPNRLMISFNFMPPAPIKESVFTADTFFYVLGKGVKMIWPQDEKRQLTICRPQPGIANEFNRALADWQKALEGRLELATAESRDCPPFSDLNTHTTTVVDGWINIEGAQGTTGFTQLSYDLANGELLDADIFILREEVVEDLRLRNSNFDAKADSATNDAAMRQFYFEIFQHELGHLLGLHHQFDHGVKSIMGYDPAVTTMQPYDIQAIQALYPLKNPTAN